MTDNPTLQIFVEQHFIVGQDTFIDSIAENGNAVVFEDNEETGYFYAVSNNSTLTILDALHIYDVANVLDSNKASKIKILWTEDLMKVLLSINDYYHAIFDFKNNAGYCRNAFPDPKTSWTVVKERLLTDALLNKLLHN